MESRSILNGLRQHAGLKIFAAVLAIVSWYLVREETSYEQTIRGVAINITPPDGWTVHAQSFTHAGVLFRGSRGDLRDLVTGDIEIDIDMRKAEARETSIVRLAAKHVRAPAGVRALRVEPSAITVNLEKK